MNFSHHMLQYRTKDFQKAICSALNRFLKEKRQKMWTYNTLKFDRTSVQNKLKTLKNAVNKL